MKRSRTLMYDVASFVIYRGQATVHDLSPQFPGFTAYQLRKALQNASQKGIIKCLHSGQQRGVHGCGAATYGPRDSKKLAVGPAHKPQQGRVPTSVFDLDGVMIPSSAGHVCCPLGRW